MIKPKALRKGDTIGIVSPASPIEEKHKESFENGIQALNNMGYLTKVGRNALKSDGYLSATDEERASDLMEMFKDKSINAILCSRGGYGTERLLNMLDFQVIAQNPKIFAGYSNISFLLNIFTQYSGFITFHSPMVINIGNCQEDFNVNNMISSISIIQRNYILGMKAEGISKSKSAAIATGRLYGGNLSTIIGTIGTKYELDTENCILFIEEVGEHVYAIDRMLTLLKNAGKLNSCSGFILGDFTDCENSSGKSIINVINEVILSLGKPIIHSFPCGHGPVKSTLPIGAKVQINANTGIVKVLESVIKK
ncbi:MAG: S66 peptidase family protein [Ignavibacteriales bacterium]